jgi:ketosteroid isomerase-like protein
MMPGDDDGAATKSSSTTAGSAAPDAGTARRLHSRLVLLVPTLEERIRRNMAAPGGVPAAPATMHDLELGKGGIDVDAQEFSTAIDGFRTALMSYVRGDHEPVANCFSTAEDVTLANPLGPPRRGWAEVYAGIANGAESFRAGGVLRFETVETSFDELSRYATPDLGYVVQLERHEGRVVGSAEPVVVSLRVTLIFRPEDGRWKIVHRHADPITTARSITTTIQSPEA